MKPLAFIIITYNRPQDVLELLKNIVQLDKANELIEEIIVVNNASTADYTKVEKYARSIQALVTYIMAPHNLGVTKGRNFAIEKSSAPILILIDDDAVLENKDCLTNIITGFSTQNTSRPKAIISFKVLYYDTHKMQQNALPHKQYNAYKDKHHFETYYYAGGAHAIRRTVLEEVGKYPEDFFYGMEEYDLSYRILDADYCIIYSSSVVMLHKESPFGRKPKNEKLRMMWVNKSRVAWRHLPKRYFYSTAVLWSLQYLRMTNFDVKGFILGWKQIAGIKTQEPRKPIRPSTLRYLRKLQARLWY